jgi:ABC-type histidine transport system ATPase subunit
MGALSIKHVIKRFGPVEVLKGIESLPKAQSLLSQAQKVFAMRR